MNLTEFKLYQLVVKEGQGIWAVIVIAACLAGIFQGFIVVIINEVASNLATGGLNFRYFLLFCITILAYSLVSYYASSRATAVTEKIVFSTYVKIADRIRNAKTLAFETIGKQRIYATLNTNTDIILESAKSLAGVGAAIAMIGFSFVYIAIMSRSAILAIIIFYVFGIFVYLTNFRRVRRLLDDADRNTEKFKGLFSHFLEGFKEVKVDRDKSDDLFENHIQKLSEPTASARIEAEDQLTGNTVFIQSFYYVIIAAMLFLLPRITVIEPFVVIKIAAVVLFSYGSMTRIVMSVPLILKSEKAIDRLDLLEKELTQAAETARPYANRLTIPKSLERTLSVSDLRFSYPATGDDDAAFELGPVSFDIQSGQIVFIVGGNGSGKTTLLKLLCGLYYPKSGHITLDGEIIDDRNYADYRNLFSVVFSDYHIFDRFFGRTTVDDELVTDTLFKLGLQERVRWVDHRFSDLRLSAGQRKRLALLCGYVDRSPFLVMDEVAADLDPEFRAFFYQEFLEELRSQGRTVIAVSHDEKYFPSADHLVKLENGVIVSQ